MRRKYEGTNYVWTTNMHTPTVVCKEKIPSIVVYIGSELIVTSDANIAVTE